MSHSSNRPSDRKGNATGFKPCSIVGDNPLGFLLTRRHRNSSANFFTTAHPVRSSFLACRIVEGIANSEAREPGKIPVGRPQFPDAVLQRERGNVCIVSQVTPRPASGYRASEVCMMGGT